MDFFMVKQLGAVERILKAIFSDEIYSRIAQKNNLKQSIYALKSF